MIRHPNIQGQITIPKDYLKKLNFDKDDYFDVKLGNGIIILEPINIEPKFTEDELDKLEGMFDDKDNRSEVFESGKEAIEALKNRIKGL